MAEVTHKTSGDYAQELLNGFAMVGAVPEGTSANPTAAPVAEPQKPDAQGNGQQKDYVLEKVAGQVKELATYFPKLEIDPNNTVEHTKIAEGLIKDRQFTKKNGEIVTIAQLDEAIVAIPQLKEDIIKKFGDGATFGSLIPTDEKRNAINKAIHTAEEENKGWFGTSFTNIIAGLINWIMGGKGSIGDNIAQATADSVAAHTAKNLNSTNLFSKEEIQNIAVQVRSTVMEKASGKDGEKTAETEVPKNAASADATQRTTSIAAPAAAASVVPDNEKVAENPQAPSPQKKGVKPGAKTTEKPDQTTAKKQDDGGGTKDKVDLAPAPQGKSISEIVAQSTKKIMAGFGANELVIDDATKAITTIVEKHKDLINNPAALAKKVADGLLDMNTQDPYARNTANALRDHAQRGVHVKVDDKMIKEGVSETALTKKVTGLVETLTGEFTKNKESLNAAVGNGASEKTSSNGMNLNLSAAEKKLLAGMHASMNGADHGSKNAIIGGGRQVSTGYELS